MRRRRTQKSSEIAAADDNYQKAGNANTLAQSVSKQGQSSCNAVSHFQQMMLEHKQQRMEECKRVYDNLYQKRGQREELKRDYFCAPYLDKDADSQEFLKQVTDFAYLRDLKQVLWSTYFDENLEFGAALVEVKNLELQDLQGGQFSLEIWCNGIMLHQRSLQRKPRAWNASRHKNSIIFLLEQVDETCEGDVIHILSLNEAIEKTDLDNLTNLVDVITEVKIQDWTSLCRIQENVKDIQFGYDRNNILYLSTPQVLHAVSLNDLQFNPINEIQSCAKFGPQTRQGKLEFDSEFRCLLQYDSEKSFAREDGNSCLAIFDNASVCDFNVIVAKPDEQNPRGLTLQLIQMVELAQRDKVLSGGASLFSAALKNYAKKDPITSIRNILLDQGMQATVALRQTGCVDLYWNCKKISSTKELDEPFTYTDIETNFQNILLRRFAENMGEHQVVLPLEQKQRTSFANLSMIADFDIDDRAFFLNQKYKKLLNPYQEMFLHRKSLLVAHGNILSQFDMAKKMWVKHLKFTDADDGDMDEMTPDQSFAYATKKNVLRIFRYDSDQSDFSLGVLFQDGSFRHLLVEQDVHGDDQFEEQSVDGQIVGQMVSIASDREHHRILYVISVVDDQAKLWGFCKGKLKELTKARVSPKAKIVPYFAPAEATQVVIIEPEDNFFRIYEHLSGYEGENGFQRDKPDAEDGAAGVLEQSFNVRIIKKVYDAGLSERIDMDSLHSVIATKNQELIIFFDAQDMHVYDMRTASLDNKTKDYRGSTTTTYKKMYVRGLQLLEDRYMYVMCEGLVSKLDRSSMGPEQRAKVAAISNSSGLGIIDLDTLLSEQQRRPLITPIMSAICGVNSEIMYSDNNKKLVVMQGFNRVGILPLLHLNVLPFEGMKHKTQYLFAQQFNDKFIAVEAKKNKRWCWDMQTGKLTHEKCEEKFRISEFVPEAGMVGNDDFDVYRTKGETEDNRQSIYDQGTLPYTLLYLKRANVQVDCCSFFRDRIKPKPYQKSHLENQETAFHTFVVVGLDDSGEVEVKTHFIFPKLIESPQYILISEDYSRVFEIIPQQTVSIYRLERSNKGLLSTVHFEGHVRRPPYGIYDRDRYTQYCLFSPDFSKHLDVDPVNKQWVVRESLTGQIFFEIPSTFLSFNPRDRSQVIQQARFMAWEDERQISLIDITAEPIIHEIIQIPETKDAPKQLSYEVASGAVQYLDMEPYSHSYEGRNDRPLGLYNFFKGNLTLGIHDVKSRLKRSHRILKNIWYLNERERTIEYQVENDMDERFENTYSKLFRVDYVSHPQQYFIELPFTFVMWRKIEMLSMMSNSTTLQNSTMALKLPFTPDIVQKICLCILPDCKQVLHSITRNFDFIEYFLSFAYSQDGKETFIIPFIEDMYGKTALHNSIEPETGNSRTTEYFLTRLLPNMPFDHHGRAIHDLIPKLVQEELPYLGNYLDSRLITTKQLRKVCRQDKRAIKETKGSSGEEKEYVTISDLWPDENLLLDRVFDDSCKGQEVTIEFLDFPNLHRPQSVVAQELADSLADVEDRSIFKYKSIRALVSFRWGLTKQFVRDKQLAPYAGFFLAYLVYAFIILPWDRNFRARSEADREYPVLFTIIDKTWLLLLCVFSLYFLHQEWRSIKLDGCAYFTSTNSFWNYCDILPPIGIITITILDFFSHESSADDAMVTVRYCIQGLVCFGMWLKIFYFLRIYRDTGFFVNMFVKVVYEIKVFFLLYILILCAFAFTFYIQAPSGISPLYFLNQTYLIGLGADDMDWSAFPAPAMMQLFYLGGTLFITIVMLNLLIAIISEAYEEVTAQQQEANDLERVQLIADVADLIDEDKREALALPNEYLIRATVQDTNVEDPVNSAKAAQ